MTAPLEKVLTPITVQKTEKFPVWALGAALPVIALETMSPTKVLLYMTKVTTGTTLHRRPSLSNFAKAAAASHLISLVDRS